MSVRSALTSLCLALSLAACGVEEAEPPAAQPFPLTGCAALDEASCNAAPRCVAVYGEEAAPQPVPVVAVATSGCMPFEPVQPLPFHHCEELAPVDGCAGLDEATCSVTPGCAVVVAGDGAPEGAVDVVAYPSHGGCVRVPGVPVPGPLPVDPPVEGVVCPAVACLLYCEQGYATDAAGCPACACLP
jgi:hypothetical protein